MLEKNNQPLPLSFRTELLKTVLADLRAGECCSLIGTSSTGKSNLARFLQRHDVQNMYWKDNRTWIILIDSHSLIFAEQKAGYVVTEMMIEGLLAEAKKRNSSSEFLAWATDLNIRLIENTNAFTAMRSLQEICRHLCEDEELQLILVFDQFEDIWQSLEARFFLNLRHLRDQFKYQVVYLVMTRNRLQYLRDDAEKVEAFWELFSDHTYGLGPYNERDAATMVERLAARADVPMNNVSPEIIRLSGGHSGLLRTIFWVFRNSPRESFGIDELLQVQSVREECDKVWTTLSSSEKLLAQNIVQGFHHHRSSAETLNELRLKEIVSGDPPTFFSPVFAAYVAQKTEGNVLGVVVDVSLRKVWLDGQPLQHSFTHLEFELLEHLARHSGVVCKRDDLLRTLYGDEAYYDKTDQRLYAILSRLRDALGEDAHNPRYLHTHRGGGIQLLQGHIINEGL